MADTADLIVLGAYYGTGNKGMATQNTIGLKNSEGRVCVRLFLRSAVSEPDTDWNCEL